MKRASSPATPDLMTLLCLIGDGMREAGSVQVWMHLLLIGTMSPQLSVLLKTWLLVEERFAAPGAWDGAPHAFDDDDDDDDYDDDDDEVGAVRSGWLSQDGPVWRWRQVTCFGSVLIVLYRWFCAMPNTARLKWGAVWAPAGSPLRLFPEIFSCGSGQYHRLTR